MADVGSAENLYCVEASLLYLVAANQVCGSVASTTRSDWPGRSAFYPMRIYDARPVAQNLSLDLHGFILVSHATAVRNFYDPWEVRFVYYPEVEALVKRVTGAAKVVIFAHDVRCRYRAKAGEIGVREPVTAVHNDYTPTSGPQMVRESLDSTEAQRRLMSRFAEVNVWRPIQGPVRRTPLALCDARSSQQQDLVKTDLKHEVYMALHSASHRWFYFPQMQTEEVVILKCYDSAEDGRARFTLHAAFEDPTTPAAAPARESVEVRALLFFSD